MQHRINKAIQAYYDSIIENRIVEKNVQKVVKKGNNLLISTTDKVYIKTIKNG